MVPATHKPGSPPSNPLDGLKVLIAAERFPVPFAAMLLADMGADVVTVERASGDPLRAVPSLFEALNRGKRNVILDPKSQSGKEDFRYLVGHADILIEGFKPGTMAKLGFDYETLKLCNARLIYASVSGFGQFGPYRNRPAHDLSCLALSGVAKHLGESNVKAGMELPLADVSAALFAVIGVLALLNNRHTSDVGGYADISMMDAFLSLTTPFFSQALSHNIQALTDDPAYGVFRCLDDESITFSIAGEDHLVRIMRCCGTGGSGNSSLSGARRKL